MAEAKELFILINTHSETDSTTTSSQRQVKLDLYDSINEAYSENDIVSVVERRAIEITTVPLERGLTPEGSNITYLVGNPTAPQNGRKRS